MTLYDTIALSQTDFIACEKRESKQGEAEEKEMGSARWLSLHEVVGLLVGSVNAGHVENSLRQEESCTLVRSLSLYDPAISKEWGKAARCASELECRGMFHDSCLSNHCYMFSICYSQFIPTFNWFKCVWHKEQKVIWLRLRACWLFKAFNRWLWWDLNSQPLNCCSMPAESPVHNPLRQRTTHTRTSGYANQTS